MRFGEGPVGRNTGFRIDLPHVLTSGDYTGAEDTDRREIWANRAAIDFATDAAQEYRMPDEAISISGKINGAAIDRGIDHSNAYARHLEVI